MRAEKSIARLGYVSQQAADAGEILGVAAHVRGDERRARMRRDERLERGHEPVEGGEPGAGERPLGVHAELLEPLVAVVDRVEERDRVGGVDEHRQSEHAGLVEQRAQPRVVGQQQLAGRIAERQPEVLPDLQPAGAAGVALAQARDQRGSNPGSAARRKSTWQNVANRPGWARS